jgi:hypothetical protein
LPSSLPSDPIKFITSIDIHNLIYQVYGREYMCTFGSGLMGRLEARKKRTAQARHGPIYQARFGPRSRPMGGHEHGSFKAGTKWPI